MIDFRCRAAVCTLKVHSCFHYRLIVYDCTCWRSWGKSQFLAFLKALRLKALSACRDCDAEESVVPVAGGWLNVVLIFPSNSLLMSILLHGWVWKGLTKSSLLYRGAWTPGAGGSVSRRLCRERQAFAFVYPCHLALFLWCCFQVSAAVLLPFHEERKAEK